MNLYNEPIESNLSQKVIEISNDIHKQKGIELKEKEYKQALFLELHKEGLHVELDKKLHYTSRDQKFDAGYKIDLLVENELVIELMTYETLSDLHFVQTLKYLRVGDYKTGLILNFNASNFKEGIIKVEKG